MGNTEWTLRTLHLHIQMQIDALRAYHDQDSDSQAKALKAALLASTTAAERQDLALEKRLESMNEFREALSDQSSSFLTREEYNVNHKSLVDRVNALGSRVERAEGRSVGINNLWMVVVAAISTIGVVIASVILIAGR